MKLLYLLAFFSFSAFQPKAADPIERTVLMFKQSNLEELYKTFAPSIELTILNDDNVYSKEQAGIIVNNFFTKNPISSVKVIHRVDSNPDLRFAVVMLISKNGNYRTSFSLRNSNGTFRITELRIEEEKVK